MRTLQQVKWVADGGHEWLQIPIGDARKILAAGGKISEFSYKDSRHAYLEGDCDAVLWFDHFNALARDITTVVNYDGLDAPCRDMARF